MNSFFDMGLEEHLGKETHLMKISNLLNWANFSKILGDVHSDLGPEGYDPLQMFKCLLLQAWHSLSDPGLEDSLRVRLDFLQFTGFSVGSNLPDETTLCRFRSKLLKQKKYEKLFKEVNEVSKEGDCKIEESVDQDAGWLKKGKKSYFGYRGFARLDKEGFI